MTRFGKISAIAILSGWLAIGIALFIVQKKWLIPFDGQYQIGRGSYLIISAIYLALIIIILIANRRPAA